MESLNNKEKLALKLKDESGNYLIACEDRKSVKTTSNPKPPEIAQWIIKGDDPQKRVRLVSIFGKFLAAEALTGRMIQVEKGAKDCNRWWRLGESEKGFPKVYLRASQHELDYYLMTLYDGRVKWDYFGREKWLCKGMARWIVQIVNNPKPFIEEDEEEEETRGATIVKIGRQVNNYNKGRGDQHKYYVNSGNNVNYGPGKQFNGSVKIHTGH